MDLLFSFSGRIRQSSYWRGLAIVCLLWFGVYVSMVQAGWSYTVLGGIVLWCWLALHTKRLHDVGFGGAMAFTMAVAVAGGAAALALLMHALAGVNAGELMSELIRGAVQDGRIAEEDAGRLVIQAQAARVVLRQTIWLNTVAFALASVLGGLFLGLFKPARHRNRFGAPPD